MVRDGWGGEMRGKNKSGPTSARSLVQPITESPLRLPEDLQHKENPGYDDERAKEVDKLKAWVWVLDQGDRRHSVAGGI